MSAIHSIRSHPIPSHPVKKVHRDLKPSNILLASSDANTLKIADFSMALSVRAGPITSNGGDPEIVAPEILLARPYLTVTIFSFAAAGGGTSVVLCLRAGGEGTFLVEDRCSTVGLRMRDQ